MKEAESFLNKLLVKNDTIVMAISGGPDSMFLLHVLNTYKEKYNLKLICAHVNHGLRKESNDEAKFVEDYCKQNNIIFEYMIISGYKDNKFSEEQGRQKRYGFFEKLQNKYNAKYLMTAHHGDDLMESILMRIVRGSNLKGYIGIPKITYGDKYTIVRPLLYLTKEEICDYLDKNNIKYVVDKSNNDEKYTRNRYRKHLLPFLKNEDKNVHLKFLEYSEELEKNNKYINEIIDNKYNKIVKNNIIDIELLNKENTFIKEKIIERLIEVIQKDYLFDINKKQLTNIMELLSSNDNKAIDLSNSFIARKSYNKLYIEKKNEKEDYNIEFYNNIVINNKYKFELIDNIDSKSNYIIRLDSKEIVLPLFIRNKKNGDKMIVKNLKGSKKVKDIFIDSKVDLKERDNYPILVDSNNTILWIPGIKKSTFDKDISEKCDIIIRCMEEEYE